MSLAAVNSPEALLLALQSQKDRRLPLTLGRHANDNAGDVAVADELEHYWLVPGGIVELSSLPGAGAWSLAFTIAALARRRAIATNHPRWIGALDPWSTLSAMALAHLLHPVAGDDDPDALRETLVVRPREDALLRTATRITRSGACTAVVVDAAGLDNVSSLILGLRRLAIAADETQAAVILVTSESAHRSQPLPVAARAQVVPAADGAGTVVRPLRHRNGMPPRMTIPKGRLQRSVIEHLVAECRASAAAEPL